MSQCEVWKYALASRAFIRIDQFEEIGSANEIATMLPDGVYTTFRTYAKTQTLTLERHFDRLEESASILGVSVKIDRADLRQKLRIAIIESSFKENRVRIHIPLSKDPQVYYLILEQLVVPKEEDYAKGVTVITRRMHREKASAKSSQFIKDAVSVRQDLAENINEVLMVGEDGNILEGLSSNFYAVADGVVWTAQLGVLPGLTREIVLGQIQKARILLRLEGYPLENLLQIEEAFITSASRGVLPVASIDGNVIGNKMPGAITLRVGRLYESSISELIAEI